MRRSDADYIMMHNVNIEDAHCQPRTMVFLEVEIQKNILISPDQLVWAVILRLMSISTTRKSSNKHRFSVDVTSGDKIGEGRIRNLTGDVLFPVTCKRTISTISHHHTHCDHDKPEALLVRHVQ